MRTEHFGRLDLPCLFVSGTRDAFATPAELEEAVALIPGKVSLHWVEGGDHGLRGRDGPVAATVAAWLADRVGGLLAHCVRVQPRLAPLRVAGQQLVRTGRAPRPLGIAFHWRRGIQQRLYDPPRLLDAVLPGEQARFALQGIAEQPLVRLRQIPELLGEDQGKVDRPRRLSPGSLGLHNHVRPGVGVDPQYELVRVGIVVRGEGEVGQSV